METAVRTDAGRQVMRIVQSAYACELGMPEMVAA